MHDAAEVAAELDSGSVSDAAQEATFSESEGSGDAAACQCEQSDEVESGGMVED